MLVQQFSSEIIPSVFYPVNMLDISSGICPVLPLVAEQSWVSSVEEFEQAFLPVISPHTKPQNRPFLRDTKV